MSDIWAWLSLTLAPVVLYQLYILHRYRRTLCSNVPPLCQVGSEARDPGTSTSPLAPLDATVAPATAGEAVVCVDPLGRCTTANLAARRLLRRAPEEIVLSECVRDGAQILASVADKGVVECDAVVSTHPSPAIFHLRAIAFRDRDNNFWGAAVFIRPPTLTAAEAASESPTH